MLRQKHKAPGQKLDAHWEKNPVGIVGGGEGVPFKHPRVKFEHLFE